MSDIILPIDGDIRPLEAKVNRFASKGVNLNLRNNLSQPLGRITGQVSEFNKSLEASNARVLAFGASAGAVYAVGRAFQEVIKSSVEVEKQLLDINVVLNASQQNLDRFGKSLFDIARNTANPFSAVSKAATELARQGLGVEETLKRTSDALILSRLSGLDAAKSVEALTAAVNSFSKAGLTSTQVINKLANVDAAFAVSSADLAEAISRVGSTAQDVGVDIDELISLVTAAQQTTARGGSVIGNSFKTIFTRLQRSDTLSELEGLGIAVRDLTGETLPAVQILQNLAKTFNTLSSSQKASLAETVGGVYQINILRAALGDLGKQYGIYNSALGISRNSTNEAIKRNEELNKSNDALLKQLLTDFKQAGKEIGDIVFAPTIKDTAGFISKLLEDFRKPEESRSAGSQLATEVLKGFGDFVSGPGIAIATAGLAKIFLNLAKFSAEAFKGFMGIQSGADKLAAAQQRINAILAQNPSLIDAAVAKSSNMLAVEQKILSIITAQNNARVQATQLSTKLAPAVIVAEAAATKRVKGRAEGFIPNFSNSIDQDQIIENIGAANHKNGYKAGKAYRTNLYDGTGKSIPSIINTAEKRKDFINSEGKRASLVIPPNGFAKGFVPNFAPITFNPKRHISLGGTLGRSNKSTAEGLSRLISLMGIPYTGSITKDGLSKLFASKKNKLKLYQFLKKESILVKRYPELYSEIKDGNHRFELAQIAGIKNIPARYLSKGFIPNFNRVSESVKRARLIGEQIGMDRFKLSGSEKEFFNQYAKKNGLKNGKDYGFADDELFIPAKTYNDFNLQFRRNQEANAKDRATDKNKKTYQEYQQGLRKTKKGKSAPYAYSLVYPGAGLSSGEYPTYGLADGTPISFTAFPFPVGKGDFGKETYALVQKSIVDVSKKILSDAGVKPKILNRDKFTNKIRSNLSLDSINNLVGNAFEAGLLASINVIPGDRTRNLDLSQADMRALGRNFPTARKLSNKKGGDFKPSVSPDSLNSMALKIARAEKLLINEPKSKSTPSLAGSRKSSASGFLPNEEALKLAIKREKMAGYHSNQIRVGQDNSLMSDQNPLGLGVYNTKDEPQGLKQGIKRYSLREARVAGRASGFIPNFAGNQDSGNFGGRLFAGALTASFVTPIVNSNLENKLSQEDLTTEQKKSTEGIYLLTKSLENATSGMFLGGIFGKRGQVMGGLAGAGVGLASAQGTISGAADTKRQKEISGNISRLQNEGGNLQELNAGISPKLDELITEINKKDAADSQKVKELTDIISKSISDSKIDAELKNITLNELQSRPDTIIPTLNRSQNINRTEQSIQERQLTIEQANNRNKQPTGTENFLAGLKTTLGSNANNDAFKKFESFMMANYNNRQTQIPEVLKTDKSRQNLGTELISEFAFNLDTDQFNKLSSELVGASDNAGEFIDTLISARNNLGLATGDLQELKEALKIDPKVSALTLKSFLNALGNVNKNVASSVGTGFKTMPGRVEKISNYSGVNEAYNTFEDAEDRDYQDLFPYERKAKEQEAQAQKNVMEREIKNLSPEEQKQYKNRETLRKATEFYKMGISPEQLKELDPKFSKEVEEAIASDVKSKDVKTLDSIEKTLGRKLTKDERNKIIPPKLTGKLVKKMQDEQFAKVSPTVTEKDSKGDSITKLAGVTNIGEQQKIIPGTKLTEDQKKENSNKERQIKEAEDNEKAAKEKAAQVVVPSNQPGDKTKTDPQGTLTTEDNKKGQPLYETAGFQTFAAVAAANLLPGALKGVGKGAKALFGRRTPVPSAGNPATTAVTTAANSTTATTNAARAAAQQSRNIPLPPNVPVRQPNPSAVARPTSAPARSPSILRQLFPTPAKAVDKLKNVGKGISNSGGNLVRGGLNLGRGLLTSGGTATAGYLSTPVSAVGTLGTVGTAGVGALAVGAGLAGFGAGYSIGNTKIGDKTVGERLGGGIYDFFNGGKNKEEEKKHKEKVEYLNRVRDARKAKQAETEKQSAQPSPAQARLDKVTEERKKFDLETKADAAKSSLLFPSMLSPTANAPTARMETKALFVREPGIDNIPGVTKDATAFSYYDKFFKSQEDLDKYKRSSQGNTDEIKEAYMAKREKVNKQSLYPEEDVNARSYDQEDKETERRQEQAASEKQKQLEAQQTNQTPQNAPSQTTNNISVAPTINLSQANDNDGIKQLIQQSAEAWGQRLMAEIDQKLSDRDKGITKPPMGMVGGRTSVG